MHDTSLVVDAMGGDHAPDPVVEACAALSLDPRSPCLVLVGPPEKIEPLLARHRHDAQRLRVEPCTQWVDMDEKPAAALEHKPNASISVAARLVAEGRGEALISAGNSGAVLLAASRHLGRLPGVKRAALAAVYPTELPHGERQDPFGLMLDVGATLDVSAQELVAFAVMGSAYASMVSDNPRPRVALLSNGSEPGKGLPAIVEAHQLLRALNHIDFIGNVEGLDVPRGSADVVVTGGFVGNVVLKMLEGVSDTVRSLARQAYRQKLIWRLAMLLLSSGIRQVKQLTDWQQYGGAPILGLEKLCIKAHGRSGSRAMANAIKLATKATRHDLVGKIRQGLLHIPPGNAESPTGP